MSIFKSSFAPSVQKQLKLRQSAMTNRTTQNLQYLNSRNAWIRMTSSVNVDGKSDLAKKYILQGGTLNLDPQSTDLKGASKKQGIGDFSNAYSNISQAGTKYRLGIRPMPGITSIEVKSLSAYGSLREVTVNFQCWDIQQLEDLEVLYMRPGYTALIEWGWTPYFKPDSKDPNKHTYEYNFTDYYDIINSPSQDRTKLFKDLYDKSTSHGGNYDAMFGYVKNYQWSARPDGGYDCQTNIISTGEIIESLKINYNTPVPVAIAPQSQSAFVKLLSPSGTALKTTKYNLPQGLLIDEFRSPGNSTEWIPYYQRNVLAGMWAEFYHKGKDPNAGFIAGGNSAIVGGGAARLPIKALNVQNPSISSLSSNSDHQVYITLDTMCNLLNKYIIAKGANKEPLVKLSLKSNNYESPITDLYCTAHPLQVSVDPSVCLIKNSLWYDKGGIITTTNQSVSSTNDVAIANTVFNDIKSYLLTYTSTSDSNILIDAIGKINTSSDKIGTYNLLNEKLKTPNNDSLEKILQRLTQNFSDQNTEPKLISTLSSIGITYTNNAGVKLTISSNQGNTSQSQIAILQQSQKALQNIQILSILNEYFFNGPESEIGIIKNIYVNVNYLFQESLNSNLEAGDNKGKNEILLLSYLKKIISDIQSAIGNVSNFEIHVDPVDNNVARIIDVNYTEPTKAIYDNLFELQVHNLESVVRSYSLQSQIFPNQGAVIAIGSQAKGGQLGMQTNTFIDFNRNLTDRIIPEKIDGTLTPTGSFVNNTPTVVNGMANIINVLASISDTPKVDGGAGADLTSLSLKAKNSLRDVIVYFQSLIKSPGSNRNLIPTKFSCVMDGIGGLVIGHMFRLSKDIMPKGYRGEGVGSEIGNAITSISHTISNGDWSTQIDTLNIVLDQTQSEWSLVDIEKWKELINASVSSEIALGGSGANLKPANPNIKVIPPTNPDDGTFYGEILQLIGAPITDENLKFLYAWKQGETGAAAWNPFNTTWARGFKTTPYNCNDGFPVKNYASRSDGLIATVNTLQQNDYNKIRNGLINNEGAYQISTYIDELYKWGTGNLINKILAGNTINPPAISRTTTQIKSC
jgi:hypothetical protein